MKNKFFEDLLYSSQKSILNSKFNRNHSSSKTGSQSRIKPLAVPNVPAVSQGTV